jgi:alanine racemase
VGDKVVLWGGGVPAEAVAPFADTISYELVCGITQRVARVWR